MNALLSLFSFLMKIKTPETKIPCIAAKRKIVVHVSKEGCCIAGKNNVIDPVKSKEL